jgi:hypothetical protein
MMEDAKEIIQMSLNKEPFYRFKSKVESIAKDKEETAALLDSMETVYGKMITGNNPNSSYKSEDIINRIHYIELGRKSIQQGVSPNYVLKDLILKIGG